MEIKIIGAGLTGLTAAYRLSQKGHQVVVFEKEKQAGGLASGFQGKNWAWPVEKHFHHLFISDVVAKTLIADLGLADKLFYRRPKTSVLYHQKIAQFDSPLSLLQFPHLSLNQRLQAGLITTYLKLSGDYKKLEKITAKSWLEKYYGKKPYQILWQPLIESKFGRQANQISMAWFWARIKKRSIRLGYLEGGFQTLIEGLVKKIKASGNEIVLNREVKNLKNLEGSKIIVTTPAEVFLKISPGLSVNYQKKLKQLQMLGAINLVLELKEKFLKDGTYWLNINESDFPFVAAVEHTNFIDSKYYNNHRLLYIGGYYPQNHLYFKMKKQSLLKEFLPYLKRINAQFNRKSIVNYWLTSDLFAQPIMTVNYSQVIPQFKTPLPHVYLANMQQIYPWDRGINYAIKLGEKIAQEVEK